MARAAYSGFFSVLVEIGVDDGHLQEPAGRAVAEDVEGVERLLPLGEDLGLVGIGPIGRGPGVGQVAVPRRRRGRERQEGDEQEAGDNGREGAGRAGQGLSHGRSPIGFRFFSITLRAATPIPRPFRPSCRMEREGSGGESHGQSQTRGRSPGPAHPPPRCPDRRMPPGGHSGGGDAPRLRSPRRLLPGRRRRRREDRSGGRQHLDRRPGSGRGVRASRGRLGLRHRPRRVHRHEQPCRPGRAPASTSRS